MGLTRVFPLGLTKLPRVGDVLGLQISWRAVIVHKEVLVIRCDSRHCSAAKGIR